MTLCYEKQEYRTLDSYSEMIDKLKVLELAHDALEGSDKYVVNLKITADNRIFVDIDGDNGINIDDCIELSRAIESQLDRDVEDFELNVSSAGADSPLKMPRQYRRHIGRRLALKLMDGREIEATLQEAEDDHIVVRTKGTKKAAPETLTLAFSDIKTANVVISF